MRGMGQQIDAIRRRIGLPGNGLSLAERQARAERLLAAMESNARWAGRHLAAWAVTQERKSRVDCRLRDLRELLLEPNSVWMQGMWAKYRVHRRLRPLAQAQLVAELKARRWL